MFRGKIISSHPVIPDGLWAVGYLIGSDEKAEILGCSGIEQPGITNRYRIDHRTIGQCFGLRDKNKKLVWEGDICKFNYLNRKYVGKIVYNPKTCAFAMWNNIIVGSYGEMATNTRLLCHIENIEIIGNIFDNPELLDPGYTPSADKGQRAEGRGGVGLDTLMTTRIDEMDMFNGG